MFGHLHDSHGFQLVRRQANLDESTTTTTTTLTTTTTRLVPTNTGAANTAGGGGGNGGNGGGGAGTNTAAATTAVAQTQATRSPTTLPVSPTTTLPAFSTVSTIQPFVPGTTNFATTPANPFVTSFVNSAVQNSLATGGTGGQVTSQIQGGAGGFSTVTQTVPNTGAGGGAQTVVIVISYAPMPTSSSVSSMLNVSSTLNSTSSEIPSSMSSSFSLPSSPAESAAPANDAAGNKGLSKGAIAGIVVASVLGGLALLALLALLARYLLNRRRNRGNEDDALSMLGPAGPMSRESYAAQSGAGSGFFGGTDGPGPMMTQTR